MPFHLSIHDQNRQLNLAVVEAAAANSIMLYFCWLKIMSHTIEAIYENGIFRPLSPVDLPEGTRVRVAPGEWPANTDDLVREHLRSAGTTPAEIERILDNLRLLWGSYDSLTEPQQVEFERSRLDQEHFFDHQSQQ